MEQRPYGDFIGSLGNPTCLHLVSAVDEGGSFVLEMSPSIVFPLLDRLLGGSGDDARLPARPLTRLEQTLLGLLADRAVAALEEAWFGDDERRFDLAEFEHNPVLMQTVGPSEPSVVIGFELRLGRSTGRVHVALPLRPLNGLLTRILDARSVEENAASNPSGPQAPLERDRLLGRLSQTNITLRADLVTLPIQLQDILTLKPGDVIDTELPRTAEIKVHLDGETTFHATAGTHNGRRAVRLTSTVAERGHSEPPTPR